MERPGEKLKRARERLQLTYRDVAEASRVVALRRGSDEFLAALSRLADIENKGTVPTIYRIYTLCAVYRLEFQEVLRWYGVSLDEMLSDAARVRLKATHAVHFAAESPLPQPEDGSTSPQLTTLLRSTGGRWGTLPLQFPERRRSAAPSIWLYRAGGLVDVPHPATRIAGGHRSKPE